MSGAEPDLDAKACDRTQVARIAALTRWGRESDRTAATAPARRGLDARFEREADPDGLLTPSERALRAEALRRAHFLRMARKSAQVRRRKTQTPIPAPEPKGAA